VSQLKPISKESIPRALEKAERYRLLNEPFFAESICLDVLAVDPDDQKALVIYVLALADQFASGLEGGAEKAKAAIAKMQREYDRHYYTGIVAERRATALISRGGYGVSGAAWHHIQDAMAAYEKADALQEDPTNDDAILRYNTCVRLIHANRLTEPQHEPDTLLE
jgi:hypothetical protein